MNMYEALSLLFSLWPYILTAGITYTLSLALYRLFLDPLARFPGPKLAAVTRYYEGYYDIYQNGQYTFKIAELHKIYGPIIRISPYELHVSDPAFFDVLYRQDATYDKYAWAAKASVALGGTVFTPEHHRHRARRQPLSPFFSKSKVAGRQELIRHYLEKLLHRIENYARTGETFDLGAASTALVRDFTSKYIINKDYRSLERDDFDVVMLTAGQASGAVWRMTKFLPWFGRTLLAVPLPWMVKIASEDMKPLFRHMLESREDTKRLMAASATPDKENRNIVDDIMHSKLPPSDKELERVVQELTTIMGGGYETTASVLRLIFFHMYSDSKILQRLRDDLKAANITSGDRPDLKTLEQLPYLTAILNEGLRLSPGVATRLARVAPNTEIVYDKWRVPPGTAIGMTPILMHTDETLYPDPWRFNPDRWIEADGSLRKASKGFAPFSKGTRICLGMYLAWAQMYIVVTEFAKRFDFHFPSAGAEDFKCDSDQFAIGTKGKGVLMATVTQHVA